MSRALYILIGFLLLPRVVAAEPVQIGVLMQAAEPTSVAATPAPGDQGLAGARLAADDNNTVARFTGFEFVIQEHVVDARRDVAGATRSLLEAGVRFIVSLLPAAGVTSAAALARTQAASAILFNVKAADDELRGAGCLPNVLHTIASRAMLADGLAQYLVVKNWRRWFLVAGPEPGDRLYADALRRAAKKFGASIVVEKPWTFATANAHSDTGHVTLQAEIPAFTRVGDHDVLLVADEADTFGEYLIGRTSLPRPVVGTQGIVAAGWSSVNQQWGATQLQSRFLRRAGRAMTGADYAAWLAVRSIGEAAVRTRSADPAIVGEYLRGPDFIVAGFKGQGQSFRAWDGQMRQPILIAGPQLLVSVSPQPGFLNRTSDLDSLGADEGEGACRR